MRWILLLAIIGMTVSACTDKPDTAARRALTTHQRDSTIAASPLPGAGTVRRALAIADSSASRAARLNRAAP